MRDALGEAFVPVAADATDEALALDVVRSLPGRRVSTALRPPALHVATMRRYRTRGSVSSTTWHDERFDREAVLAEATRILDGGQRGR